MIIYADSCIDDIRVDLDLVNDKFLWEGIEYDDLTDLGNMKFKAAGGIAKTPGGALKYFPDRTLRYVNGVGILVEVERQNRLNQFNVNPTTTQGWTLVSSGSRPPGSSITVVDDTASLETAQDPVSGDYLFEDLLDNGIMNGNVVRFYNPDSVDNFIIPAIARPAGEGPSFFSMYARVVSGGFFTSITNGGATSPTYTDTNWVRVGRQHPATVGAGQVRVTLLPNSEVHIILAQYELGVQASSPIAIYGSPLTRQPDLFQFDAPGILDNPHTLLMDVYIDPADFITRRIATISNPSGSREIAIERYLDNSLRMYMTPNDEVEGVRWYPKFPRIFGPGRVLCAQRIDKDYGRTLSFAGLRRHDPFGDIPRSTTQLTVGSATDNSLPMIGWVRRIAIYPWMDNNSLQALTVTPSGSVALDLVRYISDSDGDDLLNDGKTSATPWATLAKASSGISSGTQFYLKCGDSWEEPLLPLPYCQYEPYGAGDPPWIKGTPFLLADAVTGIGINENNAPCWRAERLLIKDTKRTGMISYAFGGIQLSHCRFNSIGEGVVDAIGLSIRANTRGPTAVAVGGSPQPPAAATINDLSATIAALPGTWRVVCETPGAGTVSKWKVYRPNGVLQTLRASGNTTYNSGGLRFIIYDVGADPIVDDEFRVLVTAITDVPYPTSAIAYNFLIEYTHIDEVKGTGAGDDLYIEGIGGRVIIRGNKHDTPIGTQADCLQIGRGTDAYLKIPTNAVVTGNYMDMTTAPTTSGKGAMVIIAGSAFTSSNCVKGLNFGISYACSNAVTIYNVCEDSTLNPYSGGIVPNGGDYNVRNHIIAHNIIRNCSRGVSITGTGQGPATGPLALDIRVYDNDMIECATAYYVDRPWTGQAFNNRFKDCDTDVFVNSAVTIPTGGNWEVADIKFNFHI